MTDVYQYRAALIGSEQDIWRTFEGTSAWPVAKLAAAVIAMFKGEGSHLFDVVYHQQRYGLPLAEDPEAKNALTTMLTALGLAVGDKLVVDYDFGASWQFSLEVLAIKPMKLHAQTGYPRVIAGAGQGIIEDLFPSDIEAAVAATKRSGKAAKVANPETGGQMFWDYRKFSPEISDLDIRDRTRWLFGEYEQ